MRPEIVAADRRFEVRRAATLWRKAGEVAIETERAIAERYGDDRLRTTRLFRVLFFVFTWFGFSSAYGLFSAFFLGALGSSAGANGFAALGLGAGVAALIAAEFLHTHRRMRRFGVEEACVWIGIAWTTGGAFWLIDRLFDPSSAWAIGLGAWGFAGGCTLAAWRWGTPATGFAAAAALFVALSQAPSAHALWLLTGGLLAWPLAHLSLAEHVSPAARRRFREAFVVVSLTLYFAIHVGVVEERLIRKLRAGAWTGVDPWSPVAAPWIAAALVAMVAMPAVWLVWGIVRRVRPAIDLGLLLLAISLGSYAARFRPRPEWLYLLVAGGLLVAGAIALRRFFAARQSAEWRGLTALPLAHDRAGVANVETVAALAAFAPAARPLGAADGLEARGGEFGGGGASAKF